MRRTLMLCAFVIACILCSSVMAALDPQFQLSLDTVATVDLGAGSEPRAVFIEEDYAYVAVSDGLYLININPDSTNYLDTVSHYVDGLAMDVFVRNDTAVVAWYTSGDGIHLVNVTDKSNPVKLSEVSSGNRSNSVWIQDDSIYVCQTSAGFDIISLPGLEKSNYNMSRALDAQVQGSYAHIVGGNGTGYHRIDITSGPEYDTTTAPDTTRFEGISVNGDYAYVSYTIGNTDDTNFIYIYDISSPDTLALISTCPLYGTDHAQESYYSNGYIYNHRNRWAGDNRRFKSLPS